MAILRKTRLQPGVAFLGIFAALSAIAFVCGSDPAAAEFQVGLYGGWNDSFDSDITLIQPNGTNMTLNDVPWDGASFDNPPYWGLRGIYWLNSRPNWGLMVDYNHAKVIAEQAAVISVSGTRDGVQVGPRDRVGNTFSIMEFTDGLNEIYGGVTYRWPLERWAPYVGVAVGASFPHSRSSARGARFAPSTISSLGWRWRASSASNTVSRRGSQPLAIIS